MSPSPPRTEDGEGDIRRSGTRKRTHVTSEFDNVRRSMQAMETTFITIHDLTRDANILYCSQSITDVLEWQPDEVIGKPCWDFFHPDELSFAKNVHDRGVELDKASVLNYCRIKNKHGDWIGCECVFTVVYNVLVGCTSVYFDGPRAKKRAIEAPIVRQLFSSSPRDPRYSMLSYISSKFRAGPQPHLHEPRAAFFLNRFTRTLTINFATDGLEDQLQIPAQKLHGQSFYYCVQENCLAEAIRCLESAKGNDSIAYLRFWYRDPRSDDLERHHELMRLENDSDSDGKDSPVLDRATDQSNTMINHGVNRDSSSDDEDEDDETGGGVQLALQEYVNAGGSSTGPRGTQYQEGVHSLRISRGSTSNSDAIGDSSNQDFEHDRRHRSSTPRTATSMASPIASSIQPPFISRDNFNQNDDSESSSTAFQDLDAAAAPMSASRLKVELEAVISCTSDGLVVVLRIARPFVPSSVRAPAQPSHSPYTNGLFASPWAQRPIMPAHYGQTGAAQTNASHDLSTISASHPQYSNNALLVPRSSQLTPTPESLVENGQAMHVNDPAAGGPPVLDFMNSIRDVAVFAWALTGINGSLVQYGRGRPLVGAVPQSGLPVWERDAETAEPEVKRHADAGPHDLVSGHGGQETTTANTATADGVNSSNFNEQDSMTVDRAPDMPEQTVNERDPASP